MNDINELHALLFATLRDLRSKSAPMDLDRARAIRDVADSITAAARVEVDFQRVTRAERATPFFAAPDEGDENTRITHEPGVTRHRLIG